MQSLAEKKAAEQVSFQAVRTRMHDVRQQYAANAKLLAEKKAAEKKAAE